MIKIKFKAEYVPNLDLFRAVSDIRYYFCGIRIERAPAEIGGVYLVACDGHTLMCIHDASGTIEGCDGALLRVTPGLVAACRQKPPKKFGMLGANVVVIDKRASVATDFDVEHTDMEMFVQAGNPWIDENGRHAFPDWRRVLPDFKKLKVGAVSGMSAVYVARFAKLKSSIIGRYNSFCEIRFWHERQNGVTLVQHVGLPEAISMIMPMHPDGTYVDFNDKPFLKFPQKVDVPPAPSAQPQDSTPPRSQQ